MGSLKWGWELVSTDAAISCYSQVLAEMSYGSSLFRCLGTTLRTYAPDDPTGIPSITQRLIRVWCLVRQIMQQKSKIKIQKWNWSACWTNPPKPIPDPGSGNFAFRPFRPKPWGPTICPTFYKNSDVCVVVSTEKVRSLKSLVQIPFRNFWCKWCKWFCVSVFYLPSGHRVHW